MVVVALPYHLRSLAGVTGDVEVDAGGTPTVASLLDALEARFPVLRGTIRDHGTLRRRPFVRYYACEEDLSHDGPDTPLPAPVADGKEPFLIVGAMAGG
jgi:hypothetical protein